jgi:hypothetical protein
LHGFIGGPWVNDPVRITPRVNHIAIRIEYDGRSAIDIFHETTALSYRKNDT